jgi:hypothetical protein
MANEALVQSVLEGLIAYGQLYGLPDNNIQIQAIIGTLINVHAPQALKPQQIGHILQLVQSRFNAEAIAQAAVDQSKQALARQAHQWRESVERQVKGALDAYIHQYAPAVTTKSLQDMVIAIAPMINDGQITKPEVIGLAHTLSHTFAPNSTLSRVLNPTNLALAKNLAAVFRQRDTEAAVTETVTAYVDKFAPALEEIGESLIENALSAVLKNKVEFGIDLDLNLANKQLLIQQVSFKLNIMQQSPRPSKTAQQMAAELNAEIERFKAERQRRLGGSDVTDGTLSNDGLSIASNWVFTNKDRSEEAS